MKRPELLSPAGNMLSAMAAINAGADAIYLGTSRFSARAYADNLSEEELIKTIRRSHLSGVKVYLTLNTLLDNSELAEVVPLVKPLYESGLDGIIVQDLGVAGIIHDEFKELSLHASTQMAIMDTHGALLLKSAGFERIVPARELTLNEIKNMKQTTGLELECFIHGAMCYCYSGMCLMSSMIGGRSGNRGRCAGTCRLPFDYSYAGRKIPDEQYPLSMKDMCTVGILPELINADIDSFKIEGRMKSPEYVAGVTSLYRKYIDRILDTDLPFHVEQDDLRKLKSLYIRSDISEGYYLGNRGKSLITLDKPGYNGNDEAYINELNGRYVKAPAPIIADIDFYIHSNEQIVLTFRVNDVYASVTGETAQPAKNRPLDKERIRASLSKLGDTPFCAGNIDIDSDDASFLPVSALNDIRRRCAVLLEEMLINDRGLVYTRNSLSEAGGESTGSSLNDSDGSHTVNSSARGSGSINFTGGLKAPAAACIDTYVYTREQFDSSLKAGADRIYIEHNLFERLLEEKEFLRDAGENRELFISLPMVIRYEKNDYFTNLTREITSAFRSFNLKGILAHSLDGCAYAYEICQSPECSGLKLVCDSSVYCFNTGSVDFLRKLFPGSGLTLSEEHNLKQLHSIMDYVSDTDTEITHKVYGRTVMMVTKGCLKNTFSSCNHVSTFDCDHNIKDRTGAMFPVYADCGICANLIFNDRPLYLGNMYDKLKSLSPSRIRLDMTYETAEECELLINGFRSLYSENGSPAENKRNLYGNRAYTTGHIKRGVL